MEIIAFALGCIVGLMVNGHKFSFKANKAAHEVVTDDSDKEIKERNKRQLEHMQSLMSYDVTQAYKMGGKV